MEKDKKYLFIGDIHGDLYAANAAYFYAIENHCVPVFMGDFTDSFERTVREQKDVLRFMKMILRKDAIGLWGNHDMGYRFSNNSQYFCHGFSKTKLKEFKDLYFDIWALPYYKPYLFLPENKVLATHAGLEPEFMGPYGSLEKVLNEISGNPIKWGYDCFPYFVVGRASMGSYKVGGITWARPGEKTGPVPDVTQVCGHTPVSHVHFDVNSDTWYIDTIGDTYELLEYNETKNKFTIIEKNQWTYGTI